MLADRADPQAPPGAEERRGDQRDRDVHQVDDDRLAEQHRADRAGSRRAPGSGSARTAAGVERRGVGREHLANRKLVRPMTSTLSTTPTMTWSTMYLIANSAEHQRRPAGRRPSRRPGRPSGDPVSVATTAAANAPASSWPSIAMLTTPDRSPSTPPRAPNTSGTARRASRRAGRRPASCAGGGPGQEADHQANANMIEQPQRRAASSGVRRRPTASACSTAQTDDQQPGGRPSTGTVIVGQLHEVGSARRAGTSCRRSWAAQQHDAASSADGQHAEDAPAPCGRPIGRGRRGRRIASLVGRWALRPVAVLTSASSGGAAGRSLGSAAGPR